MPAVTLRRTGSRWRVRRYPLGRPSVAPDLFDGRHKTLGTIALPANHTFPDSNPGTVMPTAAPALGNHAKAELDGSTATPQRSRIVVYDAATREQPWWPTSPVPGEHPAAHIAYGDGTRLRARATLLTPTLIDTGEETWRSTVFYLPGPQVQATRYATADTSPYDWFGAAEVYGPPWNGSPPMSTGIKRDAAGQVCLDMYPGVLRVPIATDCWHELVVHTVHSPSPTVGLVEVWLDGVRQTLALPASASNYNRTGQQLLDGGRTLRCATMLADATGPESLRTMLYRSADPAITWWGRSAEPAIFHLGAKVGTTRAHVTAA